MTRSTPLAVGLAVLGVVFIVIATLYAFGVLQILVSDPSSPHHYTHMILFIVLDKAAKEVEIVQLIWCHIVPSHRISDLCHVLEFHPVVNRTWCQQAAEPGVVLWQSRKLNSGC